MIAQVRTARPSIMLGGTDYFSQLAPYFLTLTYTDNCDGQKADDLQLKLADPDRRFISDWMPDKGTSLEISIIAERWFAPNASALSLDCGQFWIDSVDFDLPDHTVTVKGCSIPTSAHIKASDEVRGWEKTTLQDIAQQIAGENGMEVEWDSEYNPRYSHIEQIHESGLEFLKKRAKDVKLSIKVARNKVIFYDEEKLEQTSPAFVLVYGDIAIPSGCYRMSGAKFTTKLVDTTKKASVSHLSQDTGELHEESFSASDDDLEEQWDQKVNENPDIEEAMSSGESQFLPRGQDEPLEGWSEEASGGSQRKAQAVVREANKDKERGTIEMSIGNPLVAAGETVELIGVGQFDGKWFIESAVHKVGPMYNTTINVRRCLEGY